jgi:nitrite reductase/ring-hydroxylating ferredoxin subunit
MKTPAVFETVSSSEIMPPEGSNGESAVNGPGELAEGSCREFRFRSGAEEREAFLVRAGGRIHGYRNACPHTGAPLNWLPDRFLTEEGDYIVCALHGALFRIEDGLCVFGPCQGRSLEKVPVRWEDGRAIPPE